MRLRTCSRVACLSACPVSIVVAIIGFTYYAYMAQYLIPMYASAPVLSLLFVVVYHALLAIHQWCYWRTVLEDPGWVPSTFQHDIEDQPLERSRRGSSRFCTKCKKPKPDRAHHCSMCGRCVLKMDHHCPWVGNCVGYGNYKFFLLFLVYTCVLGLFVAATILPELFQWNWHKLGEREIELLITFLLGLLFGGGLTMFASVHFAYVFKNLTTLEMMEKSYDRRQRRRQQMYSSAPQQDESELVVSGNPFDLGALENFREVFGPRWWLWPMPLSTSQGDGMRWRRNPHFELPESLRTTELDCTLVRKVHESYEAVKASSGEEVEREFVVCNSGSEEWPSNVSLMLVNSEQPDQALSSPFPPLVPAVAISVGEEGMLRLAFRAPNVPGTYRAEYRLGPTPSDTTFGDSLHVEVDVVE